jgi:hypothetical protein
LDEPVGWTAETAGPPGIATSFPIRIVDAGSEIPAWRFNYAMNGVAIQPLIHLICLEASNGELPITHVAASNGASVTPFNVACPEGESAVSWGEHSRQGHKTALLDANTIVGWAFHSSGYQTVYAVCLGSSSRYVTPSTYLGICDPEDAVTAYLPTAETPICLDNPPTRT